LRARGIPVSSRDEDPIAMEGNEALEYKTDATECEQSGSTRPPAESMLEALSELMLQPFVESLLNTLAESLLDATAALSLTPSSRDSTPDQYDAVSKSPCGIASASATSWSREQRREGFGDGVS
jgi:hypothetical protein